MANLKIVPILFSDSKDDSANAERLMKAIRKDANNYREGIVAVRKSVVENKDHEKFTLVTLLTNTTTGLMAASMACNMLDIPFGTRDAVESSTVTSGDYRQTFVLNDSVDKVQLPGDDKKDGE